MPTRYAHFGFESLQGAVDCVGDGVNSAGFSGIGTAGESYFVTLVRW